MDPVVRGELTPEPVAVRGATPVRGERARWRALRRPAFTLATVATLIAAPGCDRGGERAAASPTVELSPRQAEAPGERAPEWRGNYRIEPLPAAALRLEGAADGLHALTETIERGLAASDSAALLALLPTEREYREILYPAFPAAHPPINASFETVWLLQMGDTRDGVKRILREYGGRDVEILDVRFAGPDQDFVNFRLHETSEVDLVVDGERRPGARLFGSAIEVSGRWKVLSYPDH